MSANECLKYNNKKTMYLQLIAFLPFWYITCTVVGLMLGNLPNYANRKTYEEFHGFSAINTTPNRYI